jgi:hypothetical protein
MLKPNTAKSAELQVMIWFLEAGWEIFTPLADLNATDMVVREPATRELLSIQVKHKQPGARNEGQLPNPWFGTEPPFDYLVFYQPSKFRGVIVPRQKLKKKGKMFLFFADDSEGYPTGPVRPLYADFGFDLTSTSHADRSSHFVSHFSRIHQTRTALLAAAE